MDIINYVLLAMQDNLTTEQLQKLRNVLTLALARSETDKTDLALSPDGWVPTLGLFLASKRLAGCADSTITQYERALRMMITFINKPVKDITTNDLRYYMAQYQSTRNVSAAYMDTMRLYFSSFFTWLQDEEIIQANPARRLERIKAPERIKHPFTQDELTALRDVCGTVRDRALLEVLYATACRVGEVCSMDIADVDFKSREMIVYGQKGKAERRVYLTPEAVYHLRKYLISRNDDCPALFATLRAPARRITKGAIEAVLRKLGDDAGVHCHPHKFRRTMLTEAAKRGMPIQEVQKMAGHKKLDTTMMYVTVSDESVKASYNRFIA